MQDSSNEAPAVGQPELEAAARDAASAIPEMSLEQALAALNQAEAGLREKEDAWLRAKAETENVRKRAAADLAQARKFALESFASELLSVMDSLDAALQVKEASLESYRSGVELTARQLATVFEKFSISEINPAGEKFDPNRHQAIASLESDTVPANMVLSVMQKGFALNERVLRPALVTVSKGKTAAAP
ncbi:MAG: nucleotide exchange factor GrpE [Betaproteobacteria bacterium]|nr:nucleotide exchange factor GrpE [Betaproteobacteria bacterium]